MKATPATRLTACPAVMPGWLPAAVNTTGTTPAIPMPTSPKPTTPPATVPVARPTVSPTPASSPPHRSTRRGPNRATTRSERKRVATIAAANSA